MTALALALALAAHAHGSEAGPDYLPSGPAAAYLEVERGGQPQRKLVVMTQAVAIRETGPRETVARFGETYAFSPSFLALEVGVPTEIEFWNLQPDDVHDVFFVAPDQSVLMHWKLPPLSKIAFTFTFRKAGLYGFVCGLHAPEMAGQILVVPAGT